MNKFKILTYSFIFSAFALSSCNKNKTEVITENKSDSSKVIKDSATIIAEKEAAAKAEIASLPKIYNPEDNAEQKISEAVALAKKENKNVMIQAGGNWCIWCLRFNNYVQTTPKLKNLVDKNYVYYHLNYSPEVKNDKVFAKYGDPGKKFGYPVFIVLDQNGKQIHTQDSSVLEDGKGYSLEKVMKFFSDYAPKS
ncbi:thioredoxin family protein [Halpernia frigidisoli]|uniref:Thioredoxin-like n=1 Tax=Halpernia frigidisoli TaxID=1125876 RepID=A0A1I3EBP1_9FLAO|nr:thioredoxin family protein [Halpernia frigidisoli]SFH96111.1 Thioredoxin-like [Halpernia frigidisoli]